MQDGVQGLLGCPDTGACWGGSWTGTPAPSSPEWEMRQLVHLHRPLDTDPRDPLRAAQTGTHGDASTEAARGSEGEGAGEGERSGESRRALQGGSPCPLPAAVHSHCEGGREVKLLSLGEKMTWEELGVSK